METKAAYQGARVGVFISLSLSLARVWVDVDRTPRTVYRRILFTDSSTPEWILVYALGTHEPGSLFVTFSSGR